MVSLLLHQHIRRKESPASCTAKPEPLFCPGAILEKKSGTPVSAEEAVKGKLVLLYFSAHWCPPCRKFTPRLKEFYEAANKMNKQLEIVFVSCDEDETSAREYFDSHGDWLMAPYASPLSWELKRRFGVWAGPDRAVLGTKGQRTGIPTLVLVDTATSAELDFQARMKVEDAVVKGGGVRIDACIHSFKAATQYVN